jgi:hypothetical protein
MRTKFSKAGIVLVTRTLADAALKYFYDLHITIYDVVKTQLTRDVVITYRECPEHGDEWWWAPS